VACGAAKADQAHQVRLLGGRVAALTGAPPGRPGRQATGTARVAVAAADRLW
jgi:hypothetical protein